MANDAGFTPQVVPIKLLFPLLDGASMEEDEDLHTMGAALLANASSPDMSKVKHNFDDEAKRSLQTPKFSGDRFERWSFDAIGQSPALL